MSSSLKAVFESLAPGNLYRVRLYCAPIRELATSDIGRRNFNDRSRRGGKTRKANADVTHSCSPDTCIGPLPRPAVFLLAYGSDGGITLPSKPSLLLTIEETLSAFTVRRYENFGPNSE